MQPLFSQDPSKPMNPASTMKLLTTFAGLELLGPDYPLAHRGLRGGQHRRRSARWQPRAQGLRRPEGDAGAVSGTRRTAARHRPDDDPWRSRARSHVLRARCTRPVRIRRRAAQTLQRRARCAAGEFQERALRVRAERRRRRRRRARGAGIGEPDDSRRAAPRGGECGDWRAALQATFANRPRCRRRHLRRPLPGGVRRARLVRRVARSSAFRLRAPSRNFGSPPAAASAAACATASCARARSRSRRSNRRRSTTSSATSTSCRTT